MEFSAEPELSTNSPPKGINESFGSEREAANDFSCNRSESNFTYKQDTPPKQQKPQQQAPHTIAIKKSQQTPHFQALAKRALVKQQLML